MRMLAKGPPQLSLSCLVRPERQALLHLAMPADLDLSVLTFDFVRTAGNGPGFSQTPLNQQGLHGVSGVPTGSRPSVEEMLALTEPLKLPEWSGVSSNESHESPVLGADGWPSADWNAWNSWSDWNQSSTSTWLPAAFVQR